MFITRKLIEVREAMVPEFISQRVPFRVETPQSQHSLDY